MLFSGKGFSQLANAQPQATTANYYKAEFSDGDETVQKEFMNMVHGYIDMALYAVQGKLPLSLTLIRKAGSAILMAFR